jgi:cytochrome c5
MRSNRAFLLLAVLLVVAASTVSACGGGAAEQPPAQESVSLDGETLLQERCTDCHGLGETTSARKTRAEWDETVTRMISKGAELNDEEKTILLDYLAENYGP